MRKASHCCVVYYNYILQDNSNRVKGYHEESGLRRSMPYGAQLYCAGMILGVKMDRAQGILLAYRLIYRWFRTLGGDARTIVAA